MDKIGLTVDAQTFNIIIAGLDELPHKISRTIIDELYKQAHPQTKQESASGSLADKIIQ
jgi:hypothetical protein